MFSAPPPPGVVPCDQGSNCWEGDQLAILAEDTSLIGRVRYFLTQLKVGSRQLADGNHRVSDGMHQLQTGLAAASDGTIQLADGQKLLTTKLGEISAGAAAARSGARTDLGRHQADFTANARPHRRPAPGTRLPQRGQRQCERWQRMRASMSLKAHFRIRG